MPSCISYKVAHVQSGDQRRMSKARSLLFTQRGIRIHGGFPTSRSASPNIISHSHFGARLPPSRSRCSRHKHATRFAGVAGAHETGGAGSETTGDKRSSSSSEARTNQEKEGWKQLDVAIRMLNQVLSMGDMFGAYSSARAKPAAPADGRTEVDVEATKDGATGRRVKWKWIRFRVNSHGKTQIAGDGVEEYFTLPVTQYAILDPTHIRRTPDERAFQLSLPIGAMVSEVAGYASTSADGASGWSDLLPQIVMRPAIDAVGRRVVITGEDPSLGIAALDQHFKLQVEGVLGWGAGSEPPEDEKSANAAENSDRPSDGTSSPLPINQSPTSPTFDSDSVRPDSGESEVLAFQASDGTAEACPGEVARVWDVQCDVQATVELEVPSPLSYVPRVVLRPALVLVSSAIAQVLQPRFLELLKQDYERWADKARERQLDEGVGSLHKPQTTSNEQDVDSSCDPEESNLLAVEAKGDQMPLVGKPSDIEGIGMERAESGR
ncbi:hypothetical protein CYMTET_47513 [Cymbomonas tetramitiformis]|uniref:Uncharacterized protein n=1 Tax=Cymbomonas tetramitiformis TaxID=36881 RepID=A0AAE0BVZ8_9CHLO|nr:hypothetical protein CYMTET_47513 [Cymbomonas tetramitiformis]